MQERVVITGMGMISPLGLTVPESWEKLVNGVSGVATITQFDPLESAVQIACEVKDYDPMRDMSVKDARRRDPFEQFAASAAREALSQSGLVVTEENAGRFSVIVSAAIGGLQSFQDTVMTTYRDGPRRISPFAIPMLMPNGAAGLIAIDIGAMGPCFSVGSACASGADGIGVAWLMIRAGLIDAAIAGASEATITPVGIGAFDRVGALSRRNEDYSMTPQPFDLNRDGLVMGEGAGILILERESLAQARGAEILAELAGYGATADAFHVTAPLETGAGGAAAMTQAMQISGVDPADIDYINAHGTATQLNDVSETRAIKASFGDLAYNIPVSSTKSMTGHIMGATGALEAIFCVQAIRENVVPPTIHYQTPDPDCDLDYVPNEARELPVRVALSNAFGFGGHNAVLALREYT